ncbi:MAG: phosphate/phosphite/phosphonate ABC transporter substrate-binding protein [Lysobacterales bacterium]
MLLCLLLLLLGPGLANASLDRPDTLVIGKISDNPRVDVGHLQPLLDYVVPRMDKEVIVRGEVLLARDVVQMRNYLRRGRIDWVTETAAMAAMLGADAGAKPIVRAMRTDEGAYRSVVFVRRDSGIESLAQLRGKVLGLQSRWSTSAFYLPLLMLKAEGLPVIEIATPDELPPADQVGFTLARTESNIANWVEKGLVDAGAFSNGNWDNPRIMPEAFRAHMRLLAESESVPRAVEMVRADLDSRLRQSLTAVLLGAGDDAAADQALRAYFGTTRFVSIDADSSAALMRLGAKVLELRRDVE